MIANRLKADRPGGCSIVAPACLALLVSLVAASAGALAPRPGEPVAVVYWPGTSRQEIMAIHAEAGIPAVGLSSVSWIVHAAPLDAEMRRRLSDAGALFYIDVNAALALCGTKGDPR